MRVMLKIEFPVESGNAAMKDASMPATITAILEEQKPEAVYFFDSNGKRAAIMIVEVSKGSDIPRMVEPWFLAFRASVELHPVMTLQELQEAGPSIAATVTKYGHHRT